MTVKDLIERKQFRIKGFSAKYQATINLGRANNVGEWMSGSIGQDFGVSGMNDEYQCSIHNINEFGFDIIGSVMGIAVEHTYRFEDLELV
jgi:hypothetical protein